MEPSAEQKSVEIGVALYEATGVTSLEQIDPKTADSITELAEFFQNHPDPIFTIRKVAQSSKGDGLNHLLGYVKLSKEKMAAQRQLEQLDKQLSYYGN